MAITASTVDEASPEKATDDKANPPQATIAIKPGMIYFFIRSSERVLRNYLKSTAAWPQIPAEVLSQFEFCFLSKASSHSISFSSEDAPFFRKLLPSLRKLPQSKPLGCVLGICALFRYVPRGPGLGASASMIARMSSRGNAHDF